MPVESAADLDSFFDTDYFATRGIITGPAVTPPLVQFTRELNVIFDADTNEVALYPETDVAAANPSFLCKSMDLAGVKRGMTFQMPDLAAHEDGYGKTYEITPRILREGKNTSRVHLKEL